MLTLQIFKSKIYLLGRLAYMYFGSIILNILLKIFIMVKTCHVIICHAIMFNVKYMVTCQASDIKLP